MLSVEGMAYGSIYCCLLLLALLFEMQGEEGKVLQVMLSLDEGGPLLRQSGGSRQRLACGDRFLHVELARFPPPRFTKRCTCCFLMANKPALVLMNSSTTAHVHDGT